MLLLQISSLLLLLLLSSSSSNAEEAHPHQGKVTPFEAGDPGVKLDPKALAILAAGKPYQTQIEAGQGGRGLVVQDVKAPPSIVWERILDFPAYPKMVPKTVESKVYRRQKLAKGQERIWVRMKIGFPVLKLQFFINHLYDPALHSMTWTLDYSTKSDLDDSCGYWYVVEHPDNPNHSRVYYSVEVSMFDWVPKFVVDFMSKQALTDATAWVKKYSEREAQKQGVGTEEDATTAEPPEKKMRWWGKRPSKAAEAPANEEKPVPAVQKVKPIGVSRYALVSSALALSFYNVHLYFSQ